MTVTTTARPVGLDEEPAPPTPTEDRRLLLAGAVLLLGLFADGWAHTNILDELESFLSPYHALIFIGFLLTAVSVLLAVRDRRAPGRSALRSLPAPYRPALIGTAGFAVGFTGDGVWHTIFGIEAGIDALLSPTHLLMAASMALVLSSPLRAHDAGASDDDVLPWRVAGSVAATTLVVSFFLMFTFATASGLLLVGAGDSLVEAAGLMQTMLTTAVLAAAVRVLLDRGTPPPGALSVILVGVPTAQHGLVEFAHATQLVAFVLGALVVELAVHRGGRRPDLLLATWSVVTWSSVWGVVLLGDGTTWSPELVAGSVVLATAVAWWTGRRSPRAVTTLGVTTV